MDNNYKKYYICNGSLLGYTCSASDICDNAVEDEQKKECPLETVTLVSHHDEEIRPTEQNADDNKPDNKKPKPKKTKKKTKAGLLPKLNEKLSAFVG